MSTNLIEQEFNRTLKEQLSAMPFDLMSTSTFWRQMAEVAIQHTSPVMVGLSSSEFRALTQFKEGLNCYQFACLNNNLETKSATDLGLSLEDYCDLMDEVEKLSVLWNDKTKDTRENLIKNIVHDKKQMKPV